LRATNLAAVTVNGIDAGRQPPGGYATGFEPPQFVPASIVGQQGWTCSPEAIVSSLVAVFNPDTGAQHLRLLDNGGVGNGTTSVVLSPTFGPLAETTVSFRYSINNVVPGPAGGAAYEFVPQSAAQGVVATHVLFDFTGDILVLDDVGGGSLEFVDTGADWVVGGGYHTFTVALSQSDDLLRYFHDGQPIFTGAGGLFGARQLDQLAIAHDNFQHPDETADFDNIDIAVVPEPASLIALALGAAATMRARRHRGVTLRRRNSTADPTGASHAAAAGSGTTVSTTSLPVPPR
jgi:hypothetical protein